MKLLERYRAWRQREQRFNRRFNDLRIQKRYLQAISKKGKK